MRCSWIACLGMLLACSCATLGASEPDLSASGANLANIDPTFNVIDVQDESNVYEGTEDGAVAEPCTCVHYTMCKTSIVDGTGIIDIRLRACEHNFEACCAADQIVDNQTTVAPPTYAPPTYAPPTYAPPTHAPPTHAPPPADMPDTCGKRNSDGAGSIRIVGIENGEAQYAEFPWMVAVISQTTVIGKSTQNIYECGGSLIRPGVVLTAAHCVQGKSRLQVRAGEWDTQHAYEPIPTQTRAVRHVEIHSEFNSGSLYNDIALLFLESPMDTRASNVGLICLPPQDENMDDRECVATGWGKNSFEKEGSYQEILKKVELPIFPREKCIELLKQTRLGKRFKLHPSFLCAGGEIGKDTCKGDGGSPLACLSRTNPGVYVQAGIVSWGIGCGSETPGVYVDVAKFRHWIEEKLTMDIAPKISSSEPYSFVPIESTVPTLEGNTEEESKIINYNSHAK